MAFLTVTKLGRKYEGREILKDISFNYQKKENLAIAGATGSGKTTLLKILAGLLQAHEGAVIFEGERIKGPEEKLIPGHPRIAYLSQDFELLNHYRVQEVLERDNKMNAAHTALLCDVCRITHLLNRWTHQLSGGERQRIALARLLLSTPSLLLLDEPYSNLDAFHKQVLKEVIKDLGSELDTGCILVSHDTEDMLPWAHSIIILQDGKLVQHGAPGDIYFRPVNSYAAELFGKYTLVDEMFINKFQPYSNQKLPIGSFLRPGQFMVRPDGEGVIAEVMSCHFMGNYFEIDVRVDELVITIHHLTSIEPGERLYVSVVSGG